MKTQERTWQSASSPRPAWGFLLLDAHPAGCERTVLDLANAIPRLADGRQGRRPVALVIGSSAGYGLAMTVAGLLRHGITGLGVCFEKAPGRRTGTAGWYRTAATAGLDARYGGQLTFLNADAFTDETKDQAAAILADRYGPLDYLVYSVAAPRRTDPDTGTTYASVLKPLGQAATMRTLTFTPGGEPALGEAVIAPASQQEKDATVAVMGGADWERWVTALNGKGLLADGVPDRRADLYRLGADRARLPARHHRRGQDRPGGNRRPHNQDPAAPAARLDAASTARPSPRRPPTSRHRLLRLPAARSPRRQLSSHPLSRRASSGTSSPGHAPLDTDEDGRIRLDQWELDATVQAEVARRWHAATPADIGELADIGWFRAQFRALYGFDVPGIDYTAEVETDIPWPGEEIPVNQP